MSKRIGLDLPDDLHAWLVEEAQRNRRSLHAQVLWILEQAASSWYDQLPRTMTQRVSFNDEPDPHDRTARPDPTGKRDPTSRHQKG